MKQMFKKIKTCVETYKEKRKRLNENLEFIKSTHLSDEINDLWVENVKNSTHKQIQRTRLEDLEKSQLALSYIVNDLKNKKVNVTTYRRDKKQLTRFIDRVSNMECVKNA